jgi:hypothetical protein
MPGLRAIPSGERAASQAGNSTVRRVGYQASEQEIVLARDVSFDIAPGGIVCWTDRELRQVRGRRPA